MNEAGAMEGRMSEEEKRMLEHRLTVLEMSIEQVRRSSDERMDAIMARFDKIDRRAAWWVNGIFAIALATGGIYLEAYLNKDEKAVWAHPAIVDVG